MVHKKKVSFIVFLFIIFSCVSSIGLFPIQQRTTQENKVPDTEQNLEPIADSSVDWWPMIHHDPTHTGYSSGSAPNEGNVLWRYQTGGKISSSPVISNGQVYVGSVDKKIYCLDVDGNRDGTPKKIWSYTTDGYVYASPAVADGKVYITSEDNILYCLDAAGPNDETTMLLWKYTLGGSPCSPLVYNGKVYVGATNSIYCLDALGDPTTQTTTLIWSYSSGDSYSSPAVMDNKIYIGSQKGAHERRLFCLDATGNPDTQTTTLLWSFAYDTLSWASITDPVISNGQVFFGVSTPDTGKLFCLDANGNGDGSTQELWNLTFPKFYTPAIKNDNLYICDSFNSKLICININTREQLWSHTFPGSLNYILGSPAITDDKIFVGTKAWKMYCLDTSTGVELYNVSTHGEVFSSPAVADGKVFFGCDDKNLTCIREENPPITPDQPAGPLQGYAGEELTYSTTTIDPEQDQVYYQWQIGSTLTAWKGPIDSESIYEDTITFPTKGTYEIKIKAKDSYNQESDWSLPSSITITTRPPTLDVIVPTSVIEDTSFQIAVIANYLPVDQAKIEFASQTVYTDKTGIVTLTAPLVTRNTPQTLTVSSEGYPIVQKTITILNQPEQTKGDRGWIFGFVYDTTGAPLQDANICLSSSTPDGTIKDCFLTDTEGLYLSKAMPIGIYTLEASKIGYTTIIKTMVEVETMIAFQIDFTLERSEITPPVSPTQEQINTAIKTGDVGATITFQKTGATIGYEQTIYADFSITHTIDVDDKKISMFVEGKDIDSGRTIIITIEENVLFDPEHELVFEYDGKKISDIANDLTDVLNPNDEQIPEYFIKKEANNILLFISIPSFSDHTITISSVITLVSIIVLSAVYVTIFCLGASAFIVPIIRGTVRFRRKRI